MPQLRMIACLALACALPGLAAEPAQAAFISTAGSGFVPFTFDGSGTQSLSIDLDGDGTTDFTVEGSYVAPNTGGGTPVAIATGANSVYSGGATPQAVAFPDTTFSNNPVSNASFQSGQIVIAYLGSGGYSFFHYLGPNANMPGQHNGFIEVEVADPLTDTSTLGYIAGSYLDPSEYGTASFTVTDFGIDVPVPEPAPILIFGAAVLAMTMRRRAH